MIKKCARGIIVMLLAGILLIPRISRAESAEIAGLADLRAGITLYPPKVVYKEKKPIPWGFLGLLAGILALFIIGDDESPGPGVLVVTAPPP